MSKCYSSSHSFDSIYLALICIYSGHSLSGQSQQSPPSLIWPAIYTATTVNAFTLPSHHFSIVGTMLADGVDLFMLLEKDYYSNQFATDSVW